MSVCRRLKFFTAVGVFGLLNSSLSLAGIWNASGCKAREGGTHLPQNQKLVDTNPSSGNTMGTGNPATVVLGKTALWESGATALELLEITEDSRCPKDVTCIWEGQLVAQVALRKKAGDNVREEKFALTFRAGHPDLAAKEWEGIRVVLVDVQPDKGELKDEGMKDESKGGVREHYALTFSISTRQ